MKILSYRIENNLIYVHTDNISRPDFTYLVNKFKSLKELEIEINLSIACEGKRKSINESNNMILINELNNSITKGVNNE